MAKAPTYTKDGKTYTYTYDTGNTALNTTGTGSALPTGMLIKQGTENKSAVDLLKKAGLVDASRTDNVLTAQDIQLARQFAGVSGTNNTIGNSTLNKIISNINTAKTNAEVEQAKADLEKAQAEASNWQNLYQGFETKLQANQDQYNANLASNLAASKNAINDSYNNAARQYYIKSQQDEEALPEKLSNLGVTGGATESALLNLQNAYGTNLATNEANRNTALANAQQGYNNSASEYATSMNDKLANVYLQQATSEMERQQEAKTLAEKEAQAQAEAEAKADLVAKNNTTRSREAERLRQGYKTVHWTDADGVYHYRLAGKKASTSTKSSGTSSGGGSGTSSGGSNDNPTNDDGDGDGKFEPKKTTVKDINIATVNNYVLKNAQKAMTNRTAVIKDLQAKVKSGDITGLEYDMILAKL